MEFSEPRDHLEANFVPIFKQIEDIVLNWQGVMVERYDSCPIRSRRDASVPLALEMFYSRYQNNLRKICPFFIIYKPSSLTLESRTGISPRWLYRKLFSANYPLDNTKVAFFEDCGPCRHWFYDCMTKTDPAVFYKRYEVSRNGRYKYECANTSLLGFLYEVCLFGAIDSCAKNIVGTLTEEEYQRQLKNWKIIPRTIYISGYKDEVQATWQLRQDELALVERKGTDRNAEYHIRIGFKKDFSVEFVKTIYAGLKFMLTDGGGAADLQNLP